MTIDILINGGNKLFRLFEKKKNNSNLAVQQDINILDIKNNLIYTRDNLVIAILKIN